MRRRPPGRLPPRPPASRAAPMRAGGAARRSSAGGPRAKKRRRITPAAVAVEFSPARSLLSSRAKCPQLQPSSAASVARALGSSSAPARLRSVGRREAARRPLLRVSCSGCPFPFVAFSWRARPWRFNSVSVRFVCPAVHRRGRSMPARTLYQDCLGVNPSERCAQFQKEQIKSTAPERAVPYTSGKGQRKHLSLTKETPSPRDIQLCGQYDRLRVCRLWLIWSAIAYSTVTASSEWFRSCCTFLRLPVLWYLLTA